jgi:hypothetical protein
MPAIAATNNSPQAGKSRYTCASTLGRNPIPAISAIKNSHTEASAMSTRESTPKENLFSVVCERFVADIAGILLSRVDAIVMNET